MHEYNELRVAVSRPGPPQLEILGDERDWSAKGYNFRSMYAYPTSVADSIRSSGNTKGLKGQPVVSTVLFLDADSDSDAVACQRLLRELGVLHFIYSTSNRGLHFHIPIRKMVGTDVIHSQITWLKNNGFWGVVDTSIYREGGQYRLIGATHQKTGGIKKEVGVIDGLTLEIPTVKTPIVTRMVSTRVADPEDFPAERRDYFLNLTSHRDVGGRTPHFFILWKQGIRAGFSEECIAEDILWYNDNYCHPPHHEEYVKGKVWGFS